MSPLLGKSGDLISLRGHEMQWPMYFQVTQSEILLLFFFFKFYFIFKLYITVLDSDTTENT